MADGTNITDQPTQALVELGLTGLEAEAYAALLREASATGYRVAQMLGKPVANTYKALESLGLKGAVIVDDGENRLFRAVPPVEFLAAVKQRFVEKHEQAAKALAKLAPPAADDRLYRLQSREQVMQRCRAMLARCEYVAVMDLFPPVVFELLSDLEVAAARGVEVVVKAYRDIAVDGARVIVRPRGYEIVDAIPGSLLSLNVDGREHLLAMLADDGDRVHQAIWTGSAIIAYVLYNGLVNEVSQVAVMQELAGDGDRASLQARFESLRHLHPISSRGPVYQALLRHMGIATAADPSAPPGAEGVT